MDHRQENPLAMVLAILSEAIADHPYINNVFVTVRDGELRVVGTYELEPNSPTVSMHAKLAEVLENPLPFLMYADQALHAHERYADEQATNAAAGISDIAEA